MTHSSRCMSEWISNAWLAPLLYWIAATILILGFCGSAESSPVRTSHDAEQVLLVSPSFRVSVDRHTGLPSVIESLTPTPACLWNQVGRKLVIAVEDRDQTWDRAFDRLSGLKSLKGHDGVGRYVGTCSELRADGIDGCASLGLKLYEDRLTIHAKVRFGSPPNCPVIVRLAQPYSPELWTRAVFFEPQGRALVSKPDQTRLFKYADSPYDRITDDFAAERWKWLTTNLPTRKVDGWPLDDIGSPRGILEARDRFFLYGNVDISSFDSLAVNWRGACPCLLRMPRQVRSGDEITFNLTYKVFPKPECTLADVCRWYSINVHSSDKLSNGIVTLPSRQTPRTLDYGNVFMQFDVKSADKQVGLAMKHLWFFRMDDEVPAPSSPEEQALMAQIRDAQSHGIKVYQYFRQLAHERRFYRDHPRFKDWALRPRPNMLWAWGLGPISNSSVNWIGTDQQQYLAQDFCNPEFTEWYISEVKRFIDRYRPDGIAWDMGWDTYISPCLRHPDSGIYHGILRVQKEIYDYIKRSYPDMRVIQNESVGSPSMLYCDAVMSEEGLGISSEMLANVNHFRVALVGLYLCGLTASSMGSNGRAPTSTM